MLFPDSTVWIDYFAPKKTAQTILLETALDTGLVMTGDLIITEVLHGVRDDQKYERIKRFLLSLRCVTLTNIPIAIRAAEHYRVLRKKGITIRKTIDMIVGTYCIENDIPILHHDRDFDQMEHYLGLKVVH